MFVPYWSLIVICLSLSLILGCGALCLVATRALNRTLAEHIHKMAKQMLDDRARIGALSIELANCRTDLGNCLFSDATPVGAHNLKGPVH